MLYSALIGALLMASSAYAEPISPEQATVLAHRLLGGIIQDAQVFDQDGTTYIAIHRLPFERSHENQLILLRSFGGSFIKEVDLDTLNFSGGAVQELEVGDFNGDGLIDVYWQYIYGGSGLVTVTFKIYDSSTSGIYSSTLMSAYQPSTNLTLDPNLPPSLLPYLESKVSEHRLFDVPAELNSEVILSWRDRYGAFTNRQSVSITLDENLEPLLEESTPSRCTVSAEVSAGDWRYISCFKDNVYAVNQSESVFYTVYSPLTTYDWIVELEAHDGIVTIYERDNSTILFDPVARLLRRR